MSRQKCISLWLEGGVLLAMFLLLFLCLPVVAHAQESDTELMALSAGQTGAVSNDYDAQPYSPATGSAGTSADADGVFPGVYVVKVDQNADKAGVSEQNPETVGIPSIADANLADQPTTESPAIIQGAAVGYEEKTGATEYTQIKERDAPYSYFKYKILEEQGQDGTVHKKLSGFDGTYVIVRIDVSSLFEGASANSYLHVKQDDNRALLVATGMTNNTFCGSLTTALDGYKAGSVYKTGSYRLTDMFDQLGLDRNTPYLDIILFATACNVAGADAGKEGALTGDIPLHFYIDDTEKYNDVVYDPQSTDPNHIAQCLSKFYDTAAAALSKVSNYLVKGSDLALETMVENSGGDIVLVPGRLVNYGTLINVEGAHIYLAAATEAIIPIEPTLEAPTVTSKRITLDPPVGSVIENYGTIINDGYIVPASVELLDNTGFGALTWPGDHPELFKLINYGTIINRGFIWGWPNAPQPRLVPATGDTPASWILSALFVCAICSLLTSVALGRFRREWGCDGSTE